MLQAYALKSILKKYGDVEIINFTSEKSERQYQIIPSSIIDKFRFFKNDRKHFIKVFYEKKGYTEFQRYKLKLSNKKLYANQLYTIVEKFDVIVAGSDQIWNVDMNDFDEAFFCDWFKGKKVAYAPSLGQTDISTSSKAEKYKKYIDSFDFISAREKFGSLCLKKLLKKDIPIVLDPTLLVTKEEWKRLIGKPLIASEYIFYYSWAYLCNELNILVKEKSAGKKMPVYVLDAHKWSNSHHKKYGFNLLSRGGPSVFLNLMYYAKECYVESFHGLLFAYIFNKDFWILNVSENLKEDDIRLYEMMSLLNVQNRLLWPNRKDISSDISFNSSRLDFYAKKSFLYLDEAFK
ncbi:hypothetical protein JO40_09750 [Treponema putidum]|nr:hypothetical protein JO40_09750 [Treponema putidum]